MRGETKKVKACCERRADREQTESLLKQTTGEKVEMADSTFTSQASSSKPKTKRERLKVERLRG